MRRALNRQMSCGPAKEIVMASDTLEQEPREDGELSWDVPKARRCLRCETSFDSAWSGERICPRCKRSEAWRRGEPLR